MTSDFN